LIVTLRPSTSYVNCVSRVDPGRAATCTIAISACASTPWWSKVSAYRNMLCRRRQDVAPVQVAMLKPVFLAPAPSSGKTHRADVLECAPAPKVPKTILVTYALDGGQGQARLQEDALGLDQARERAVLQVHAGVVEDEHRVQLVLVENVCFARATAPGIDCCKRMVRPQRVCEIATAAAPGRSFSECLVLA